jgi:TIR domain
MSNIDEKLDVFISYSRSDRAVVKFIYEHLAQRHWRVFWDITDIPIQELWEPLILHKLRVAKTIVVLWSKAAVASEWVLKEAEIALSANKLLQGQLEDCEIPEPFTAYQRAPMQGWRGNMEHQGFRDLMAALSRIIEPGNVVITMPNPLEDEYITEEHLSLVHSCWRREDKDKEYGNQRMYQIHLMLIGQPKALNRVRSVHYRLDDAYKDQKTRVESERSRNFGFYQLANGYSVIKAVVTIEGQDRPVRISRFVNLTETGPNLNQQFIPNYSSRRRMS